MTDHVENFGPDLSHPENFSYVSGEEGIRTFCCIVQQFSRWDDIPVECILTKRDQKMMLTFQYQRLSSISSTWELNSASHKPIRIIFVFMND